MRILQINTSVSYGSTGHIAEGIGKLFQEMGHESYIAYGRINGKSNSSLVKIGTYKDIYNHGLLTLLSDKHGLGSKKATKNFISKIKELKPDAIGLHNIHGYYLNYQIFFEYIKKENIPVLWTLHDCWPFTGHCSYFDLVSCDKWKTHCNNCPLKRSYPKSFADRSFKNFENKKTAFTNIKQLKIISPSQWLANHIKQSFLKEYPVHVVYNGIDLDVFKPKVKSETIEQKIILGVANVWDERKGLKDFIKLNKILSDNYQIVLIGLSTQQIKELPSGMLGIKRTKSIESLVKWYNKATVFVNPSYIDNFPTTNIEALACGTPIVSYNTGGCPEAISQNTGRIVVKSDISGIRDAIKSIRKDTATIKACRNRAKKMFNAKERYKDYLNLYQNILNK